MSLAELKRCVLPAYGESWEDAVALLQSDPYEREVLVHLKHAIARGEIKEAVVIQEGRVSNGMHRVVASILSGAVDVLVSDQYPEEIEEAVEIEYLVKLPAQLLADGSDELDHVCGILRSFPAREEWLNCDSFARCNGVYSSVWTWPLSDVDTLKQILRRRMAEHDASMEILSARKMEYEE